MTVKKEPSGRRCDRPYLVPHRLEEVILLIQYLGLGKSYAIKSTTAIAREILPESSGEHGGWDSIARDHPEFFCATEDGTTRLSVRLFLSEGGLPDRLDVEFVNKLVDQAMKLHERQLLSKQDEDKRLQDEQERASLRREEWREWIIMIGAGVAGAASLANLIWHFNK